MRHRKEFEFLHIGVVQVALRTMFRSGLDTPILAILRDKRHKDSSNSLLGIIESNLADGPAYFNCYTSFTVALDDPHFFKVLTLDIIGQGLNLEEGVKKLTLFYKITYKTLTTTMEPKALVASPKGKTMLIEANLNKSSVSIPKMLSWDTLTRNPKWILDNAFVPPKREKKLSHIIEHPKFEDELPKFLVIKENMGSKESIKCYYF